jgi:hypothetical protein
VSIKHLLYHKLHLWQNYNQALRLSAVDFISPLTEATLHLLDQSWGSYIL